MATLSLALEKVDFIPPNRVTDDTSVLTLKTLVFEPLVKWVDGYARPGLFSHWTHSPDGRCWRFFIREGATFHDGKPCVAEDIIAFIDGILDSTDMFGMKWSYSRYLAGTEISADPGNCVALTCPQPFADVLDIFSEFFICRLADDGSPTLGTGRYRVTDFSPRQSVTLERVDRAAGGPDTISAIEAPSAEDRFRQLGDSTVDAALNLERMHDPVSFDPAFDWGRETNTLSVMFYLNAASGLFAAADARLAINHAVDTDSLIAEVFHGLGVAAATVASPFHLGFREAGITPIAHDPDRARALLDGCGGPGGITLRTPLTMPERSPEISAFVADALGTVGIDATIETETDRPDYARQVGAKRIGDMAIFDSSPHSTFRILDDKISSKTQAVWWQGYDDPAFEAQFATARATVADDARAGAYGRCLAHLNAAPPWLYLIHPIEVFGAHKDIPGLRLDHKGVLNIA